MTTIDYKTELIQKGLELLEIDRLVLAIHDQSFPGSAEEDIGRGSPYSRSGREFLSFVQKLGFNGVQLGPQGKTTRSDPSPYTGTIFSRNILSIAPWQLAQDRALKGLFESADFNRLRNAHIAVSDRDRVHYGAAWEIAHAVVELTHTRFRESGGQPGFHDQYDQFRKSMSYAAVDWFTRDGIYEALTEQYGTGDWRKWEPLDRRLFQPLESESAAAVRRLEEIRRKWTNRIDRFAFGQFLLDRQHRELRDWIELVGLRLYGDFQIGLSHQDIWGWNQLFMPGYLMGAPPSRSNPEGQPWGFPVLDPHKYEEKSVSHTMRGAALRLVEARIDKMLTEFDGIRIDHPHGMVCPWVYRTDVEDPFAAVRNGSRLFSSPDLSDHPRLAEYALVGREQLNADPTCPRHADDWIVSLRPDQVDRYAVVLDIVLERAAAHGRNREDILCEVLSTWPRPLRAAMEARGLGRFCVTQKADPNNPKDVYRSENTSPHDWIMVGNHDTPPLWAQMEKPNAAEWMAKRGRILAERLTKNAEEKERLHRQLSEQPDLFCRAMFAELFLGPARSVSIFFPDLFGMTDIYNKPGTISEENWSLRVSPNYEEEYGRKISQGKALDIRASIATALRTRFAQSHEAWTLAEKLET